jgi:hypothetical protein
VRTDLVRRVAVLVALCLGGLTALVAPAPPAASAPVWAPAATAAIHPGVMMFTDGAQCTANFVYTNGTDVLIGYAAHCAGTGAATETNGCDAASLPLGTPVEIDGASRPGTLEYKAWLAMQALPTRPDADTCAYNDLALVRIDPADVSKVNPSVPHWGGPVGINQVGNPLGSQVFTYGNSSLRLGITQLSPKTGLSLGTTGGGWSHPTYTVTPGIPGDSGSALLDASGRATGVLSTLAIAPLPLSNNFGDLARELSYAQAHGFPGVALALGTEPFSPNKLPLGI